MVRYLKMIVVCFTVLVSCYKETPIIVGAKFETSFVDGDESVPVKIQIDNKTINADSYKWSFEGATITSSTDKNPGTILYIEPGIYTIKLEAQNVDGQTDSFEKKIEVVEGIDINYEVKVLKNNYPPVQVDVVNNTQGKKLMYNWSFEGANITSSTDKNPNSIIFNTPGTYTISLAVSNGFETISKVKTIEVLPDIIADFDWDVGSFDEDYQAPVIINLENKSKNVRAYSWSFEGGRPNVSIEENPSVVYEKPGNYIIKLIVDNGKKTKEIIKNITINPDTNLYIFNNLKFGINSAHNNNTEGAFFSSKLRKVLKAEEINSENEAIIDIVYLGFNSEFTYNKFISPNDVESNGFLPIINAKKTKIINKQEVCECNASLSISRFDKLHNDSELRKININETKKGLLHFSNEVIPRIILFQTEDGRKGAIKIKQFVNRGIDSYINCDIKIQKIAK